MRKKKYDNKTCMKMMRKKDPQIQEDGFHILLPYASRYVHELIDEFQKERDHGLRCWILELIGHAKSPEAIPLLVENLKSDDESFRYWAMTGLGRLNTKESRTILWDARTYTFDDEEETKCFQDDLDATRREIR